MLLLGSMLLLLIGAAMLAYPGAVWRVTEHWKQEDESAPSGLYRVHIQIGGAVFMLVGVAGVIAYFIL